MVLHNLFRKKKGVFFFLIDVLIAAFIFLVTILTLFSFRSFSPSLGGITQAVDNIYDSFCRTEVKDIGTNNIALYNLHNQNLSCPPHQSLDECIWLLRYELDVQSNTSANYETWKNISRAISGNATSWLQPNYGLEIKINKTTIYLRNASIIDLNESSTKLTRRKITVLTPNITFTAPSVTTEVIVWS